MATLMEPLNDNTEKQQHCKHPPTYNATAGGKSIIPKHTKTSWMLCFRGPIIKDDRHDYVVPESVVFDLSE